MKVEYVDHMGSDLRVVNAARVSFNKEEETLSERGEGLIAYLSRHDHFTPFTHCVVTVRETVPIFVARQRFKHTVGFTYNEVSRRYVDEGPEFYRPGMWRKRAENKKQGSLDEPVPEPFRTRLMPSNNQTTAQAYERLLEHAQDLYKEMLEAGVAPEQARMVLPQSMYTSYYCTGSLAAFARAYRLRSKEDAQKEIQELAKGWDDVIRPLFPVAWSRLVD